MLARLQHHVTGAIERGESAPIAEIKTSDRLVEAAPELLEALRGAVGYAEMNGGFCDPPFWYIRAKNAIDATEGRAQ